MKILKYLIVGSFLFSSFNIFSQNFELDTNKPLWLRIDNAIQKIESGESGEAVYLFRKILETNFNNPESEMWLGLIFDKENEYELAVKYLESALEHKNQLVILEDQYRILYKLAEIYYKLGDFITYKDYLNKIIEYSDEQILNSNLKYVMLNVLKKRGFDKFIELYRPQVRKSLKAYSLLGKYYYDTEKCNLAVEYLMQSTGSIISISIEQFKVQDPYYSFLIDNSTDKSLEHIFDLINQYSNTRDFIQNNSFYEYFYYLGKALINSGHKQSGSYILEKIYIRPESGKWGYLSNPF